MAERKAIKVQLKEDDEGAIVALFSTYGVIDHDGDVVMPGAFENGKEVPIGAWGHDTRALPVGKGLIVDGQDGARLEGRLFLDASAGRDTYATLKGLGAIAEWSYIYEPTEWEVGEQDGQEVRRLKKIDTWSVDPVLRGAGIGTRTELIKALDSKVAIPVHHTETATGAWDGPGTEASIPNDAGASVLRRMFTFRDPEGDPDTKSAYKFIHHAWTGGPGAANMTACSMGIAVLNGGRGGTTIPDADRQGVYRHLAAHLRDGDREPPELRSLTLTYADQAEHALAAVLALNYRAAELAALREKDGRSLNAANRDRLQELLAGMEETGREIKALLRETDPHKTRAQALALYHQYQGLRHHIEEVSK